MDAYDLYNVGRMLMQLGVNAIPDFSPTGAADYTRRPSSPRPDTEPIDELLATAIGIQEPSHVKEMVEALETLDRRLNANLPDEPLDWYTVETPPWDIGHPQQAIRDLAETGVLRGHVLEIGCGTGEIALMAAALGLTATGIDPVPTAIETAQHKARERSLPARFRTGNAFELNTLGEQFDTIIDSGVFHIFGDPERIRYAESLATVMLPGARLFVLCYSEHHPGGIGPRRVTQEDIRAAFADGWHVDSIEPATLENNKYTDGIPAWLASITRT